MIAAVTIVMIHSTDDEKQNSFMNGSPEEKRRAGTFMFD